MSLHDDALLLGFLLGFITAATLTCGVWIAHEEASGEILPLDQGDECLKPVKREGSK